MAGLKPAVAVDFSHLRFYTRDAVYLEGQEQCSAPLFAFQIQVQWRNTAALDKTLAALKYSDLAPEVGN